MNKRLERVETSKMVLAKMYKEIHDSVVEKGDLLITLNDGHVFFIQGFTSKESYDKMREEAEGGLNNGLETDCG